MVKKKLLTLDDLVLFCQQNNFAKFSAKESGYQLAVQVPTTFEVEESSDDNHRGMMRLKFRILHDGLNRNKSFVPHKAAVKASATIADRPIMAAIHQLDDGTWDFKSHEMEIIEDENGNQEINYIEKQVGSFSSEKPFWEHDDEYDKDYLCAYGYIAEEYTKAADIIRKKGGTKNSCELVIEEMSFNAKEKQLELNAFYLAASTLLGREDDGTEIGEGMLGSRADIADFSVENNSVFSQNEKVIEMLSALNEKIDNLNINNESLEEGGNPKPMFEKLLEQYGKSIDEIDFEYEGLSDEELEAVFAEHFTPSTENFEDSPKKRKKSEDDDSVIVDDEEQDDDDEDDDKDDDDKENQDDDENPDDKDDTPEVQSEEEEHPEELDDNTEEPEDVDYYSVNYTVSVKGSKKDFSVSLKEKLNALTILVNDTYGESDGAWYDCDVIEETKTVEFHDWWNNKHYRQSYSVKKDVYSLKGDRIETFVSFLSADEKNALEQMKANYSSIEEKLQQYESEPEKLEVLASEEYLQIKDTDAYKELAKRDTYFSMSKDELVEKLDACLLEFAKHNRIEFSATESEKKSVGVKKYSNLVNRTIKGSSRYGGIFNK